jgi:hypothetical protein
MTKKINIKGYFILFLCFFISNAMSAQKNIIGLTGNKGELLHVEAACYPDNQNMRKPDTVYNFALPSFSEMHDLGYSELSGLANGSLRFDANYIYVSTLGSEEKVTTVDVHKPLNPETGEYGSATWIYDETSQEIEFYNIESTNVWIVRYVFDERSNSGNQMQNVEPEIEYIEESVGNVVYRTEKPDKEAEKELPKKDCFIVMLHYRISN